MREVCFILTGERILHAWVGSATRVPDSQERWHLIWNHREEITEIVHTHPGGLLDFSQEDLTTMQAVEAGCGCEFTWSIATRTDYRTRHGRNGKDEEPADIPWWLDMLRQLSFTNSPSDFRNDFRLAASRPTAAEKPQPEQEPKTQKGGDTNP